MMKRFSVVVLAAEAAETGKLVKLTYDVARINWCWQYHEITKVEWAQ